MKNKIFKRGVSLAAAAVMAATTVPVTSISVSAAGLDDATAQFIADMGAGWNLGNSLDATGGSGLNTETSWSNPKTTQAMIEAVHDAGFETIRIPVSWGKHVSGSDYTVDSAWMARVKEVVDYAYEDGMHVILNIHHDNLSNTQTPSPSTPGYYPNSANKTESLKFLTSVWSQIAEEFKDYDENLIFETLNEPRLAGNKQYEWWFDASNPGATCLDAVATINEFNQEIVDVIRDSGGNNADRYIMCPGYAASTYGCTTATFKLPTDKVAHDNTRIILSVHGYSPYDLALGTATEFTNSGKNEINSLFSLLESNFTSKGIPVVIGENGVSNKDNNDARTAWAAYTYDLAKKYNIPNVLWDNNAKGNGTGGENHWYFNRKTRKWGAPDVVKAIMDSMGVEDPQIPVDDGVVEKAVQKLTGTSSYSKVFRDDKFDLDVKTVSGGGKLTYSSSDTEVVSVNSTGTVNVRGVGTAVITVHAAENANYKSADFEVTVTVTPLSITPVISDIPNQKYTGKAIEPELTVKNGYTTLVKDRDYKVSYANNINVGIATAKVTLMGNYSGSATARFNIVGNTEVAKVNTTTYTSTTDAVRINWEKVKGASGYRIYRYNTDTKKWDTVKTIGNGNTTTYRDSKLPKAGTNYSYKVKAYVKENGETIWGMASDEFVTATKPKKVSITSTSKSTTAVRLNWKKVSCSGYKIQQYNSKTGKWETIKLISSDKTTYRISGLKKNTTYKFRIQAYKKSGDTKAFGAWSSTVSVKTKK